LKIIEKNAVPVTADDDIDMDFFPQHFTLTKVSHQASLVLSSET